MLSSDLNSFWINLSMNYRLPAEFGSGIYNLFTSLLRTASSKSFGLFVAPIINIRASSLPKVLAPSN